MKGLRRGELAGVIEEDFRKEIGFQSVDRVKFRLPKNPEFTRATALVTFASQEEAQKACD